MGGEPDEYVQAAIDRDTAGATEIFDQDAQMLK